MQKILFSTHRQRQVVRGLRQRVALCRSKHAETSSSTEQRLEELEQEYLEADKRAQQDQRAAIMKSLTDWDLSMEDVWSTSETAAFKSIQKESAQLQTLQKKYQTLQATANSH